MTQHAKTGKEGSVTHRVNSDNTQNSPYSLNRRNEVIPTSVGLNRLLSKNNDFIAESFTIGSTQFIVSNYGDLWFYMSTDNVDVKLPFKGHIIINDQTDYFVALYSPVEDAHRIWSNIKDRWCHIELFPNGDFYPLSVGYKNGGVSESVIFSPGPEDIKQSHSDVGQPHYVCPSYIYNVEPSSVFRLRPSGFLNWLEQQGVKMDSLTANVEVTASDIEDGDRSRKTSYSNGLISWFGYPEEGVISGTVTNVNKFQFQTTTYISDNEGISILNEVYEIPFVMYLNSTGRLKRQSRTNLGVRLRVFTNSLDPYLGDLLYSVKGDHSTVHSNNGVFEIPAMQGDRVGIWVPQTLQSDEYEGDIVFDTNVKDLVLKPSSLNEYFVVLTCNGKPVPSVRVDISLNGSQENLISDENGVIEFIADPSNTFFSIEDEHFKSIGGNIAPYLLKANCEIPLVLLRSDVLVKLFDGASGVVRVKVGDYFNEVQITSNELLLSNLPVYFSSRADIEVDLDWYGKKQFTVNMSTPVMVIEVPKPRVVTTFQLTLLDEDNRLVSGKAGICIVDGEPHYYQCDVQGTLSIDYMSSDPITALTYAVFSEGLESDASEYVVDSDDFKEYGEDKKICVVTVRMRKTNKAKDVFDYKKVIEERYGKVQDS